jgi:hypothetical protein
MSALNVSFSHPPPALKIFLFCPRSVIFLFLLAVSSYALHAQEKQYYFFHPYTYGSDALYNPVSLLADGGFDSYQILDRQPAWNNIEWNIAATNVWRSLISPLPVISAFGWKRFIRQEIIPSSFNINDAQYAPNIALHTIGGGMEYRKISEWYDYYDVPLPYICGIATCVAYEFINEVVENGPQTSPNEDCIPDVLIFQPLGFILFSFDGAAEFFSSTLQMNDWSEQTGLSFAPFAVRNAGQNFVMKLALNRNRSTNIFFHFGEFALLGLSLKTNFEYAVSFGGGFASTGVKDLPTINGVPSNTVISGPIAGIYYDRNNSLLASVVYSTNQNTRFRMNLFPGLLSSSEYCPGIFLTISGNGSTTAGLTMRILPVGLSFFSPHK